MWLKENVDHKMSLGIDAWDKNLKLSPPPLCFFSVFDSFACEIQCPNSSLYNHLFYVDVLRAPKWYMSFGHFGRVAVTSC
jgi:hypothetical protein